MEIRYASSPEDVKCYDTARLRKEFLVDSLFQKDEVVLVYSHVDRMITGSAVPGEGRLDMTGGSGLGVDFFLQRREMVVLNLGQKGVAGADGKRYELDGNDALYIGMGTRDVTFEGSGAKFYLLSCPAHRSYPATLIPQKDAVKAHVGSKQHSNQRTIYKYLDPSLVKTCQLAVGMTKLDEGCVWNTMPPHTHDRRMEVYLYLGMPDDAFVVHMMGEPRETRHIIVRSGEAVISPSWSIHSGVGTTGYTFVWGMCGENQTYDDIDHIDNRDVL